MTETPKEWTPDMRAVDELVREDRMIRVAPDAAMRAPGREGTGMTDDTTPAARTPE